MSSIISLVAMFFVFFNRVSFGNTFTYFLTNIIFLLMGIFFLGSFLLSTEIHLNENIALNLWYFSIVFWVLSIGLLSILQKIIIKFEEKIILYTLFYSFIIGIIVGLTFLSNSIMIISDNGHYKFRFDNLLLFSLLLIYNLIIILVISYNFIKYLSNIRNNKSQIILSMITFQFTFIIFVYSMNIITQNIIFIYIFVILFLVDEIFIVFYIIKIPFPFIEFTNKIYDFIIFHRSGILLYSYNFETGEETDEALIKGSILIGINHILSNFIDRKDQLNLIKMKNRDIVFEYDNIHGYALLLTTNHKNAFIDKAVNSFMTKFSSINGNILKNLTGLIDVSEFRNAKEIILENFEPFLIK